MHTRRSGGGSTNQIIHDDTHIYVDNQQSIGDTSHTPLTPPADPQTQTQAEEPFACACDSASLDALQLPVDDD